MWWLVVLLYYRVAAFALAHQLLPVAAMCWAQSLPPVVSFEMQPLSCWCYRCYTSAGALLMISCVCLLLWLVLY